MLTGSPMPAEELIVDPGRANLIAARSRVGDVKQPPGHTYSFSRTRGSSRAVAKSAASVHSTKQTVVTNTVPSTTG